MRTVLRLKFTQHQKLKGLLLGTGNNYLVEDSPNDYWWGIGADQSGQNQLGKLLEELRDELSKPPSLNGAVVVPYARTLVQLCLLSFLSVPWRFPVVVTDE
jgi:hypothetical protein